MNVRQRHRYAGAFFAPAILFFCVTGVLQTFDLHKVRPGQSPPELVLRVAALHKNQTIELPKRKPPKREGGKADKAPETPAPISLSRALMRVFVTLTSVALAATTLLGIYLGLKAPRGRSTVVVLIILGIIAPAIILLLPGG